jgi:hypothetical protein
VSPPRARLWQLIDLVEREDHHLCAVTARLFPQGGAAPLDAAALAASLATPTGIDRLESFVGKFSRMQDTLVDKLLPAFLRASGEPVGSAIDNLHRAEALGLLDEPAHWLGARLLRNRLVHEYVDNLSQLAEALEQARRAAVTLHETYGRLVDYCRARPELLRPAEADDAQGSSDTL